MATVRSSAAYAYEAQQPMSKPEPRLKLVEEQGRRQSAAFVTPKTLFVFAVIVTLISLIVYNHVKLSEISTQIGEIKREITNTRSENTRILSELESTVSLRAIGDEAAENLGMAPLDKFQVEYVSLYRQDRIEVSPGVATPDTAGGALLFLGGTLDTLKEYIGVG